MYQEKDIQNNEIFDRLKYTEISILWQNKI